MSEIVERVAKRISRMLPLGGGRWNEPHGHDFPNQYSATEQRLIRAIARAAIAAMREPSVDMLQAATRTENRRDEGPVEVNYMVVACDIWPNMIDAALKVRS